MEHANALWWHECDNLCSGFFDFADDASDVVFDVDVKGGINLKKYFGDKALAVFVKVPSIDVLRQRLMDRETEDADSLSRRLFKANFEMAFQDHFDVVLVNENLDQSTSQAQKLYDEFKSKP